MEPRESSHLFRYIFLLRFGVVNYYSSMAKDLFGVGQIFSPK